jgi:glucose/arabinose dehydrogenase/plastocyanin
MQVGEFALSRVAAFSAVLLVICLAGGSILDARTSGLAQEATPITANQETGPALLGGDLPGDPEIQLVKVASGFSDPVNIAFPNDGTGRIFVVERAGMIRILNANGSLREEPFLDLSDQVTRPGFGGGEQGLLGLAFHPDYATNGRFYVDYNARNANNDVFITEFQVSEDDPNQADPNSERLLLRIERPFHTHSGGTIRFDASGYLFIAVGDGGALGDPYDNAQNRFSLLGKILRIDVDGGGPGQPYGIPPDNPFAGPDRYDNPFPGTIQNDDATTADSGNRRDRRRAREGRSIGQMCSACRKFRSPVRPEIWALGLRQPWTFSFDPATGDVYIADVGARSWEEINYWPAGTPAGRNYGWDWLEGSHCFPSELTECPRQQVGVVPVAEYEHGKDGCAVIALGVYRGESSPDLDGVFLNADYCNGSIRGLARDESGRWIFQELLDTALLITAGNQDETGAIYVTARTLAGEYDEETDKKPERSIEPEDALWQLVPADQVPPGAETAPLGETGVENALLEDEDEQDTGEAVVESAVGTPDALEAVAEETAIVTGTPTTERETRDDRLSDEVTIQSYDIYFDPDRVVIPADADIPFTLPNVGASLHNFSIDELHISVDIEPGATETITINSPTGSYPFYCNVPGHKEAGMTGVLIVK